MGLVRACLNGVVAVRSVVGVLRSARHIAVCFWRIGKKNGGIETVRGKLGYSTKFDGATTYLIKSTL